jgi:8-oxo-dGTP pyrophosphatase MutT (NUDIX family)
MVSRVASALAGRLTPELVRAALSDSSPFGPLRRLAETDWPKPAAVVLPVRFEPEPAVVAVIRSIRMKDHPGEVSFPGGKLEPGESLRAAAFREAHEEVGITAEHLSELGTLAPIPVVTGRYLIHPFVAHLARGVEPRVASEHEVAAVVNLPLLPWLSGERTHLAVDHEWRGAVFRMPHYPVADRILYGASALIFYELLARIATRLGVELPEPELDSELPWAKRYES